MTPKVLLPLFVGIVLIGSLSVFSMHRVETRQWGALLSALPEKITTKNITNSVYYILKQTHEPVFRKDDGQNFTSRILTRWSRSTDSMRYILCPKPGLQFDHSRDFSLNYFAVFLRGITKKYDSDALISESKDGCCEVVFFRPRTGYLDFLSVYDNAPSVNNGDYELGLGPFKISQLAADKITLKRKSMVPHGYNEIVLYDYKGASDPNLSNPAIKDFNRIAFFDIPERVKKDFIAFENLGLKSEVLIINVPDAGLREVLYNCLDVDEFRRAYFPKKKDFCNIQTVFPIGVPGAKAGLPRQQFSCSNRIGVKKPVVLANWRNDNTEQLRVFASAFQHKTGVPLKIVNYEANKLAAALNKRPRPYDLLVILLSAMRSEHIDFLSSFLGKESFLDYKIPEAELEYQALLHEDMRAKRQELAERIAHKISENHAVLTLYQGNDTLLYPKEIKNFVVGSDFMEYPEVADFRW